MFKDYLLQNWPLLLILVAFVISLMSTVFLRRKTIIRLYVLIGMIFLLSIIVFVEFAIIGKPELRTLRTVFMAIRYSATPLIIAQIMMAMVRRMKRIIFIPAILLMILNIISIFTGIVFRIDETDTLIRGPIWLIPYIFVGLYSVALIFLLIKRSNKRLIEIVPIVFLAFSLGSGLVLPFIFKEAYANIFCVTIAIALYAYYVFSMLQSTKKDSLTGLLNRHAYYADIHNDPKGISSIISIDMNGLKFLNDNGGHSAGDEALINLALCFIRPLSNKQFAYRVGGDEFIIVCRKTTEEDVIKIVNKIKKYVSETKYSCSIGYSFNPNGDKSVDDLLKESDEMMYSEKDKYYLETGKKRRESI